MTGLDLEQDRLIEVAVLITDDELNLVDEGIDLVIGAPDEVLDGMVPVVAKMHDDSGLTEAVRASTLTVAEAEQQVLDYVKRYVPDRRKAPLCGNSIATDRSFLARDMKEPDAPLPSRMVAVSSVKELARRWYPRAYYASPEKMGGHRALADIVESVEELRYYREAIFVPQPGPSTDEARAIAAAVRAEDTPQISEADGATPG